MTVVSSGSTITFAGDGVQNSFDFNFRIYRGEDLCAVLRNSEGTEERLALGTDFKILSGVGSDSGGRVQYPISGTPLPIGQSITLYREIAYTQELELVDNDPFSAQLLNEAFDRGVMRDQQLQEQVDRALKYDISTPDAERLTPQEIVQTISNARDEAVSARSGAIEAEENARGMLGDALAAQTGSETACDRALLAQSAAEEARDSAIEISLGDLSSLRSSFPVLSAPAEAPEGTTVSIVITDHADDGISSYEINTFGFGVASITGSIISWVLGTSAMDVTKAIEVTRRRRGELYSDPAVHQLLVKHVSVQDGPTIAFADSIDGYSGASVDSEGVHTPAYSVPAENALQIVSAKPEIVVVNGKMILLDGSTESVLKLAILVAAGDVIITDKGECIVASVSEETGPVTVFTPSGDQTPSSTFSLVWINKENRLPNGEQIEALGVRANHSSTEGYLSIWRHDGNEKHTCVARVTLANTGSGDYEYCSFDTPYKIPATGEYYAAVDDISNRLIGSKQVESGVAVRYDGISNVGNAYTFSPTTVVPQIAYKSSTITSAATLATPLPSVPTRAIQKPTGIALKVGAGVIGEYLGPEKELNQQRVGGGSNLVPTMTSETTDGCTITASEPLFIDADGSGPAWYVGSAQPDPKVRWSNSTRDEDLLFVFDTTQVAKGYSLKSWTSTATGVDLNPKIWTVYARRTDGAWTEVDAQSLVNKWSYGEQRDFGFTELVTFDELKFVYNSSFRGTSAKMFGIVKLTGAGEVTSTTTSIELESSESIKDKIFITGGMHNTLLVDGVEKEVSAVNETVTQGNPEILADQGLFIHSTTTPGYEGVDPLVNPSDASTYWGGNDAGPAAVDTVYVGSQFAEDTTVHGFYLRQAGNATTGGNSMTSVMVQKSPDGIVWTNVEQVAITELGENLGQYALTAPNTGKYWRLLAKSNSLCAACGWTVSYLRWFGLETIYTTTITPVTELPQVPSSVAIPDRCTLTPANYAYALEGEDLKVTGAEIVLEDNPALKRLAMAASGEGVVFKRGKIYIKEKP